MNRQEIQVLLLKYRQQKCTEEEVMQIHRWYDSLNADSRLALDESEREMLEESLLSNIREKLWGENTGEAPQAVKWRLSSFVYSGVAAAAIIGLSFLFFFNKTGNNKSVWTEPILIHKSQEQLNTFENKTNKDHKILLQDQSVVFLSPGSKIVYPALFEGNLREVQLVGDAFFEITKNPAKPFLIYSGKLITKVLGTSFFIKSRQHEKQEVEVVTGKVFVFENSDSFTSRENSDQYTKNNGVVLTPNQKATYFIESRHWITGLVENPVEIQIREHAQQQVFNNTTLPEIIAGLQQEYGIEIVLGNENLERCTFTGDLSDLSLYDKLDLICNSNASGYEIKGTRILISGTGCEDEDKNNAKR